MHSPDPLTRAIIGAALQVHRTLGPGLLESTYERCLDHELKRRGLSVTRQVPIDIVYRELVVQRAYFIDLLVDDRIVVEIKSVEQVTDVHKAQVLTQLRWARLRTGLLINFNVALLRDGVRRLSLGFAA
ncbi:MAG: GxxExxY protein [Planctomycetota bacterium]|nr:GxxExxY protein [Planctomycetota bacterium]